MTRTAQQIAEDTADEMRSREYFAKLDEGRQYRAARRAAIRGEVNEIKVRRGCADCGFNFHPAALGFDHRDPNTKARDVGRMVSIGAGMGAISREIAKCDVVCHNCHSIREHERRA